MASHDFQDQLAGWFRWFHQHPETSGREFNTTERIAELLTGIGVTIIDTGLPTGLIARIPGTSPQASQQAVALRADIDALPIGEQTGLDYASINPTVHHACGHDYHLTALLGAAQLLHDNPASGDVYLIFQPAEETAQGARQVIATGLLTDRQIRAVFGLHVRDQLPVGHLAIKPGAMSASVDRFTIDLSGRGSHAAAPDLGTDLNVALSQLVLALQTIVARRVDPMRPAVISVTRIESGQTWNVLPEAAFLEGTIRTFDNTTRDQVKAHLEAITGGIAVTHDIEATVKWSHGLGAVSNDPNLTSAVRQIALETGFTVEEAVARAGGEDFAEYQQLAPGVFALVGVASPAPGHTSQFQADYSTLALSAQLHQAVAHRWTDPAISQPGASGP